MAMPGIKVVTDSAQDFAPEFMEKRGIAVVPLTVHFGEESFKDGYELGGQAFYDKLTSSGILPRTSQPSPAAFQEVFEKLTADGSSVMAITLSSGVSGTYQSAVIARADLPGRDITVIDSKQASCGHGLMAIRASEMAHAGEPLEKIVAAVNKMIASMVTLFSVDTLDYLAKNGRIGRAQHFLGTLLKMKPILSLDKEGFVTAVERVRGKGKVIPRLVEVAEERAGTKRLQALAISHANCPDDARRLKEAVLQRFETDEVYESQIGPVIGSHAGPGTIAMFLMPK
jgi:DegV family protein with EDD domain